MTGAKFIEKTSRKKEFNENLIELTKKCGNLPCVIFADNNLHTLDDRDQDDKMLKHLYDKCFSSFKKHKTGATFLKNTDTATRIDACWTKNIPDNILKLYCGKTYAKNDGHAIFELDMDIYANGILGKMEINARPKLNTELTIERGAGFIESLKIKQEEAQEEVNAF